MKHLIPFVILLLFALPLRAADDYQQRPEYQALRDSMRHAFNDDSGGEIPPHRIYADSHLTSRARGFAADPAAYASTLMTCLPPYCPQPAQTR